MLRRKRCKANEEDSGNLTRRGSTSQSNGKEVKIERGVAGVRTTSSPKHKADGQHAIVSDLSLPQLITMSNAVYSHVSTRPDMGGSNPANTASSEMRAWTNREAKQLRTPGTENSIPD